uniref:Ig-like domain-containing protein n=1 Tax=Arion vulgaris TaxID=1028688 RepID=A0A0B7BN40_9EUPU
MEISRAVPDDSGKYTCIAKNPLGQHESSCKVTVEDRVTSSKPNTEVSHTSRTIRRTKSGNIADITSYEESSTTVRKSWRDNNNTGEVTSSSSRKTRRAEPEAEAPKFQKNLQPVTVNEGEGITLSCTVTGIPEPNIEWFQGGQLLSNDDVIHLSFHDGVAKLEISESVIEDEGDYVCKATNTAGVASTKTNVTVIVKKSAPVAEKRVASEAPRFVELLQGQNLYDGDPVTLACRISGKPDKIIWLMEGREIKSSDDFRYENAGDVYKLIIAEIFPEDGGVYTCQASNSEGQVSSSCTVYVGVPDEEPTVPVFNTFPTSVLVDEGDPVTFSCSLDNPNVTVSWSKDTRPIDFVERFTFDQSGKSATFTIPASLSTDSGNYTVTAKDDRGVNSWTFSLVVRIEDIASGQVDVQNLINYVQ